MNFVALPAFSHFSAGSVPATGFAQAFVFTGIFLEDRNARLNPSGNSQP
jgi:hypothetical protein